MILQTVGGVKRGEFLHGPIAGDLGDDRSGGDGGAAGVAINDRQFRAGEACLFIAINEAKLRWRGQTGHGAAHGEQAGLEDILRVDFLDGGVADGPMDLRMVAEQLAEFFAMFGRQ